MKGFWEIFKPGGTLPEHPDLLSEAVLPPEKRGSQKQYTLLDSFIVNLPPCGKYILPGSENWRIDKSIEGMYILLFPMEASDATSSASNAGNGNIATGAVAGFPMLTLPYYLRNTSNVNMKSITNISKSSDEFIVQSLPIFLCWKEITGAKFYRLKIQNEIKKSFLP